jgi:predicted ester cyclase
MGKQVRVSLLDVVRVENGKFAEHWGGPDLLDLLQQLGAVVSVSPERK